MTDEELVTALRDLSHDSRVVGRSMPRFGRMADMLRLLANEVEALGPADDRPAQCGFTWIGNSGEQYRCVRSPFHPRDDRPIGGGGHTALPDWAGR